ncbi:methionine permease [Malassezia cuniculi]|uniref:Methionine permease n=1 Tax=Malassezia cuniculi TaxID=948313 RepID=A0AAF0J553_9BASI|nr:methionine permease [Malassezia cuniculi]
MSPRDSLDDLRTDTLSLDAGCPPPVSLHYALSRQPSAKSTAASVRAPSAHTADAAAAAPAAAAADASADPNADHSAPTSAKPVGLLSAIFLMVNRILGTGVFSTSSTILAQGGSVGISLIYWLIGGIIAALGFAVYAEFASAFPRNGGELNYLQYVFRSPPFLVASMFAAQALLLGQAAGNANAAGQYFIHAAGGSTDAWNSKGIGVAILCAALIVHGCFLRYGLLFQNALGIFKVVILLLIVFAGFAALAGHINVPDPRNFDNAFAGSRNDIYGVSQCIYNAVWSYVGYSNLFYALGEVRNPLRTIKIAGPLALISLTTLYVLAQVAYFAAVPREDILGSNQIIAALFFKNVFGDRSARALSVFVALSAVANVFAVLFAQGRLNQALGRDAIIPFSKFFASNRPFNSPLAGLAWHTVVTLVLLLAPQQNAAYQFVLNLSSYPLNVINTAVGLALILAYLPAPLRPKCFHDWHPPFRASLPVATIFMLISLFLVVAPWIPPPADEPASSLWYALAPAVSLGFFAAGACYWLVWYVILPRLFHYSLRHVESTLSDGTPISEFLIEKHSSEKADALDSPTYSPA